MPERINNYKNNLIYFPPKIFNMFVVYFAIFSIQFSQHLFYYFTTLPHHFIIRYAESFVLSFDIPQSSYFYPLTQISPTLHSTSSIPSSFDSYFSILSDINSPFLYFSLFMFYYN